ncbi:MAG: UDP-N-acetylmuramoyl-tripeptide--D-alanyl-D-alanine ligase [Cyclobacteriaceae bacterium]
MTKNILSLYDKFSTSSGVCIDTRAIKQDNIFFALKGPNFDGNKYASQAVESGAVYAVVDDPSLKGVNKCILVENVLSTLQSLANHHRNQFNGPVLAITGSNGKTTTKELITRVLSTSFKTHSTVGNLNNHIGVPLTLLALKLDTDIAVIEMGANHLGEIASYCQITCPTHGLITNLGTAHIGEFGGRENLIRAKSELFDYVKKNNGTVFINEQDEVLLNMSKRFETSMFFPGNSIRLKGSSPYMTYIDENDANHSTSLIGEYNFLNASSAYVIGKHFEVPIEKITAAIDSYQSDNNRSQIVKIGSNTIILDAYNANPDSTIAALNNLVAFKESSKVAMLGDMKELGEYSRQEHSKVYDHAMSLGIKNIHFVGKEYSKALEKTDASVYDDVLSLIRYLKNNPISDSVVLIKGSRSMTMEQLSKHEEIWI